MEGVLIITVLCYFGGSVFYFSAACLSHPQRIEVPRLAHEVTPPVSVDRSGHITRRLPHSLSALPARNWDTDRPCRLQSRAGEDESGHIHHVYICGLAFCEWSVIGHRKAECDLHHPGCAFENIVLAKFEDTDGEVTPETMGLIYEARQRR